MVQPRLERNLKYGLLFCRWCILPLSWAYKESELGAHARDHGRIAAEQRQGGAGLVACDMALFRDMLFITSWIPI